MNIEEEEMENAPKGFLWEEKEASALARLPKTTPYSVPEMYFDELSSRINQSIFVDGLNQKENQGFTTPANYFEELSANIEANIASGEIKSLVSESGFKTPEKYFETLNANILAKTTRPKASTKVIRLWGSDLMKYVAAACMLVVTGSGLYLNNLSNATQVRNNEIVSEQMLYDIDESVIIEHLQESQNVTNAVASDKEMENYILNHYSSNDLSSNL